MKIEKLFNFFIKNIFAIMMILIMVLLVFFADKTEYPCKKVFLISNLLIASLFTVFLIIKHFIKKNIKIKNINFNKIVCITIPCFFVLQIIIFYLGYFESGWDISVIIPNAKFLARNLDIYSVDYFSIYPNNKLLVTIFALILGLNRIIEIFDIQHELMSIILVNSFISSLTSYLIYKIGTNITTNKNAFIGYLLSLPLLVFSPWNIIPYSDALGLLFPILILYIYLNKKLKYFYKYPIIAVLTYLGFSIKPQTVIIVIAIIIIEIIKLIKNMNLTTFKKIMITITISLLVIIPMNICFNKIYYLEGFRLNEDAKFGLSHFLMMGANKETNGIYYREDVWLSRSFKNQEERKKGNIKEFKRRIKSYGIKGYIIFISKKGMINYNDGTFAWSEEGTFYKKILPNPSKAEKIVRSIYYENGKLYPYYSSLMQIVWIGMLIIILKNSIVQVFNKETDYIYLVLALTIIGLTMFELIFEARARYLYTNLPIYILLAIYNKKGVKKNEK